MRESKALWMLEFYPASDPPDDDVTVLASDGEDVDLAYVSEGNWFKAHDIEFWPGVIGWSDLPDADACVADLLEGVSS